MEIKPGIYNCQPKPNFGKLYVAEDRKSALKCELSNVKTHEGLNAFQELLKEHEEAEKLLANTQKWHLKICSDGSRVVMSSANAEPFPAEQLNVKYDLDSSMVKIFRNNKEIATHTFDYYQFHDIANQVGLLLEAKIVKLLDDVEFLTNKANLERRLEDFLRKIAK